MTLDDAVGMARGGRGRGVRDRRKDIEAAHSRFFTALVLSDAIRSGSLGEVVDFWAGVAGGKVR